MGSSQQTALIAVFTFQALIFGAVIFVVISATRKKGQALRRLAVATGGVIANFSYAPTLKGAYNGRNFSLTLTWGGKNTPPYFNLCLYKDSYFKLTLYRESMLSQMGEKLGIVREVKTTDSVFDAEFLIFSDKADQAQRYLYDSSVKEAVRELFRQGFDMFSCDGKKLAIRKPDYKMECDFEPDAFKKLLEKIDFLAKRL